MNSMPKTVKVFLFISMSILTISDINAKDTLVVALLGIKMELSACVHKENGNDYLVYHLSVTNFGKEGVYFPQESLNCHFFLGDHLFTSIGFGGNGQLGVQMKMVYLRPDEVVEFEKKCSFPSNVNWLDQVRFGRLNINFLLEKDQHEVVEDWGKGRLIALSDNYIKKCKYFNLEYLPKMQRCL